MFIVLSVRIFEISGIDGSRFLFAVDQSLYSLVFCFGEIMKKIFVSAICVFLILLTAVMSGCNSSQSDTESSATPDQTSAVLSSKDEVDASSQADTVPGYGEAEEFDE